MKLSFPTFNTIHRLTSSSINILSSQPTNKVFYDILDIAGFNIFIDSNFDHTSLCYDTYMTDNPVNYSSNRNAICLTTHLVDTVIFHDLVPNNFKKEDKIILGGVLKNSHKIFFHPTVAESWSINDTNTHIIKYGLPKIQTTPNKQKKSVVLINSKNNNNLSVLFSQIKTQFPDTDMLTSTKDHSYQDLTTILQNYSICIDIEDSLNCLIASACGCYVITALPNLHNINGTFDLKDYSGINSIIESNLQYRSNTDLTSLYSIVDFSSSMTSVLNKIKQETFSI